MGLNHSLAAIFLLNGVFQIVYGYHTWLGVGVVLVGLFFGVRALREGITKPDA
jgi:hypothetical protein